MAVLFTVEILAEFTWQMYTEGWEQEHKSLLEHAAEMYAPCGMGTCQVE